MSSTLTNEEEEWKEEVDYLDKISNLLTARHGSMSNGGPTQLMDHLYLGNARDASNLSLLRRLGITHVVNCASKDIVSDLQATSARTTTRSETGSPYDPDTSGVQDYLLLGADDTQRYPLLVRHYEPTKRFIERARKGGGRTLVHCELGVNRSTALCIAYLVDTQRLTLLKALREVKYSRPNILCNEGFRRQLIQFARDRDLLRSQ